MLRSLWDVPTSVDAEDRLLAMPVGARDKERRRRECGPVFTDIWLCFGLRCAVSQPSLQSSLFQYTT